MSFLCRAAVILALIAVPRSLTAQKGVPNRPELPAGADRNDWEAYYDQGVEWLNSRQHVRAEAAFYWASRLEPRRAEPLFARYAIAWARDNERFARYLQHDPAKPFPPEMLQIDSLRFRALQRNPLVFQGLIMAAFQELPGRWRDDAMTHAWLAYGSLDFSTALAYFERALSRDHKRFEEVRYLRATTYVATGQLDSALVELGELVDTLRRRDETHVTQVYESKALVLYAVGLLQAGRRNYTAAREALESALVEDLSFYPAHLVLGQLAVDRRDQAAALREFGQAAAAAANDPVARAEYGTALVRAGRATEGATELQAAVTLESYYAEPYYWLGEALLTQNDSAAARQAFQTYAERAAANAPRLGAARQRLAVLGAAKQ